MLLLGRIPGIDRPGLGAVLPVLNRCTLLMDVGGTVRCKPVNLLQFAQMGSIYMKLFRNVENPSVRLLSNGEEATKGDEVISAARALIEQTKLNFQGYAEGKDIPKGISDVRRLRTASPATSSSNSEEGLGELIQSQLKEEYKHHMLPKIGCFFMLPAMKRIMGRFDWGEVRRLARTRRMRQRREGSRALARERHRQHAALDCQNEIAKGAEGNDD